MIADILKSEEEIQSYLPLHCSWTCFDVIELISGYYDR